MGPIAIGKLMRQNPPVDIKAYRLEEEVFQCLVIAIYIKAPISRDPVDPKGK